MCTPILNRQTSKNVLTLLSLSQVFLLHTSPLQRRGVREKTRRSPDWALGGKKSGWHICTDWQEREAERNVATLKLREAALNVLPAGSAFEDVCLFFFPFDFFRSWWYNHHYSIIFSLKQTAVFDCQSICLHNDHITE